MDNEPHIGHSGDAINLIDELLKSVHSHPITWYDELEISLKALKDALERGII